MNVYINHEKNFAFVEMRTVEEASNAMALDGIILEVIHYLFLSVDVQSYSFLLITICIVCINMLAMFISRGFL